MRFSWLSEHSSKYLYPVSRWFTLKPVLSIVGRL